MKITDLIHCLRQENGSSYAAGLMQQAADMIESQAAELAAVTAERDRAMQACEQIGKNLTAAEAELKRLNADRQLQAKFLLAAHRMLMAADLKPSSKDYLDQWAFIRDAELERLRAVADAVRGLGKIKGGKTLFEMSPSEDQECAAAWIRLNDAIAAVNKADAARGE